MATDVKYAIEIVDKWQKPLAQFESAIDRINRKKINNVVDDRAIPRVDALNSKLRQTGKHIREVESGTRSTTEQTSGWEGAIKKVGLAYIALKAVNFMADFTKDSIMATAQVEKYNVTLKTMLGSQGAARERMAEYSDIAAKTPFQLSQVVEAGNQLQAIGRYNRETLTNLGDLAAASGKPLEQVMSAYAKLSTGQRGEAVNMFRDLLISSEDWAKATGKGIKANGELMASTEEMIAALPAILKAKGFLGMMGEQSKTTEGQLSNLIDSFFQLKVAAGDHLKPTFDSLIRSASDVVGVFKEWVEVPTAQKIANEKAELNALVGAITDANTGEEVRRDLLLDLQAQYPEFLSNIDLETVKNEELLERLHKVNDAYDVRMEKVGLQARKEAAEKSYQEALAKQSGVLMYYQYKENLDKSEKDVVKILGRNQEIPMTGVSAGNKYDQLSKSSISLLKKYFKGEKDLTFEEVEYLMNYVSWTDGVNENTGFWGGVDKSDYDVAIARKKLAMENDRLNLANRKDAYASAGIVEINSDKTYQKMFGGKEYQQSKTLAAEFEALRTKPSESYTDADWQRLEAFMSGDLRYNPTRTGGYGGSGSGSGGNRLQKAEDDIAGGGRNMKVINITLDSLISTVNNVFEPGQDPAGASDFLDKLSRALTMVVNDVNYMP